MALSPGAPKGFTSLAVSTISLGLVLQVMQRWLMWQALATSTPTRRWAALVTWHVGMVRASYYPAAGQRYVAWIQALHAVNVLLLLALAMVFLLWARRRKAASTMRTS